jgi:hypothetical protein
MFACAGVAASQLASGPVNLGNPASLGNPTGMAAHTGRSRQQQPPAPASSVFGISATPQSQQPASTTGQEAVRAVPASKSLLSQTPQIEQHPEQRLEHGPAVVQPSRGQDIFDCMQQLALEADQLLPSPEAPPDCSGGGDLPKGLSLRDALVKSWNGKVSGLNCADEMVHAAMPSCAVCVSSHSLLFIARLGCWLVHRRRGYLACGDCCHL